MHCNVYCFFFNISAVFLHCDAVYFLGVTCLMSPLGLCNNHVMHFLPIHHVFVIYNTALLPRPQPLASLPPCTSHMRFSHVRHVRQSLSVYVCRT